MSPYSKVDLREQILANMRFLYPSRQALEVVTAHADTGSGTAYVVDLHCMFTREYEENQGILMTQETSSEEVGDALIGLLKQTEKLVREEIEKRRAGITVNGKRRDGDYVV